MENSVLESLENLFQVLDQSSFLKEMKAKEKLIYQNQELMNDIKKIQTMSLYDPSYLELKLKIYENVDYKKYIELEQKLNYLLLDWNQKIRQLTGDRNESN